ncbi:MAG: hypothetical protein ACR5K7_06120 [Symbiopectobacterium sp.]
MLLVLSHPWCSPDLLLMDIGVGNGAALFVTAFDFSIEFRWCAVD